MPTLLFLCTGNYYRSRFAEHLFNAQAQALDRSWTAVSRALALERGTHNVGPIAPATLAGLLTRGITVVPPITLPAQASDDDFASAQRIIAVHQLEHQPLVMQRFPAWAHRVEYWQVADTGDLSADAAFTALEREITALLYELQAP
jgi:protein-tyrosine phosphatase